MLSWKIGVLSQNWQSKYYLFSKPLCQFIPFSYYFILMLILWYRLNFVLLYTLWYFCTSSSEKRAHRTITISERIILSYSSFAPRSKAIYVHFININEDGINNSFSEAVFFLDITFIFNFRSILTDSRKTLDIRRRRLEKRGNYGFIEFFFHFLVVMKFLLYKWILSVLSIK